MLALGCEVEVAVVGSPSRLLRAAGGAWQRERVRPSRAFFFFFPPTVIGARLNILWKAVRSTSASVSVSVGAHRWRGTQPGCSEGNWEVRETALWGCFHSGSVGGFVFLFKRLSCHFYLIFFSFWHWETVFVFERQQRRRITYNQNEMLSWSNGGKIRNAQIEG